MAVRAVSDAELSQVLAEHPRAVIKYHASWCGQCRLFGPKFAKLSNDPAFQDVVFLEVDAEHNPEARKAAGVTNLPFFATFRKGALVEADSTSKLERVQDMIQHLN